MDKTFYDSVKKELFEDILPYWEKFSRDDVNTGFFGEIDNDNHQNEQIERSIVMTSRFLWTYSAVARYTKETKYLEMSHFAYKVIKEKYLDSSKGIHGQYFSKNLIGFVNAVLNDAIWNNNGGDMVASFNSYGRLEVSYYEKELHKTAGFDKLLSELSDALVPGAYNFGKLVFHPDFDPTVLGMD